MSTATIVLALAATSGLLVSPAELAVEMKDPATVVLHVDTRPDGFETGHVPGARAVLFSQFAVDERGGLGAELPPVADLVALFAGVGVMDRSRVILTGPPLATTRAFFTLDYLGHRHVRILNGGVAGWKAAGYPVEVGRVGSSGSAREPGPNEQLNGVPRPGALAEADWILHRLETSQMALVDARPDAEFTGADGGMNGAHAAGHLPGAEQLVWTDLVNRAGQFLSDAELRARLQAAGARTEVPIVAYCMVGMRASVVYFAARHLGYDAKLYDGSIVDWGNRKLPVRTGRH